MVAESESRLFLWDHPVSSYAQKIRIALREKGLAFDSQVPEGLGSGKHIPDLERANPRQEVPALIDGDLKIFDSTIILEYLEDKWPEPPLSPSKDPAAKARARMIEDVMDTQYEAMNWGYGEVTWFERATGALAEKLKGEARRQTKILQDWLANQLGGQQWFSGDQFGWADIAVIPVFNRSVYYGFHLQQSTPLQQWYERSKQRPSVKKTLDEFEEAVGKMAGAKDAYKSGERQREYRDHRLEWMIKSGGIEVVAEGLKDKNIRFSWPNALDSA